MQGWSFLDNDAGGLRSINNTGYYSATHSLYLQSCTAASCKFDVDRRTTIPTNTTTLITTSVYFAFNKAISTANNALSNFHIAVETWDAVNHWEALMEFISTSTSNGGVSAHFFHDNTVETVMSPTLLSAIDDPSTIRQGYWHHLTTTINIVTHDWVSATLDGLDFSSLMVGWKIRFIGDTTYTTVPRLPGVSSEGIRVEFAEIASGSHTSANADLFSMWFDNVVVTDTTPGQPNIIQFGIVTSSGLFQLILITTAMMYISSGFGSVMRVFAKDKGPKFLGPKFIIITGVVGTAGFLFMLIVGANLVSIACPPHAVCSG
jgi:hypothetical protein